MMKKFSLILITIFYLHSFLFTQSLLEEKDFRYAYGLYSDDLYELAISAFNDFEKKYPGSNKVKSAIYIKGDCQFFLSRFAEAVKSYAILQNRFPKTSEAKEAFLRLGQAHFYNESYSQAKQAILNYLDVFDSRSAEGYYWLGEIYFSEQKYSESERSFDESLAIDPENDITPFVQNGLIYVALRMNDSLKVISLVDEFVRKWPEHNLVAEELLLKGQVESDLRHYSEAGKTLFNSFKAADNDELRSEALFFLGENFSKQKIWSKSEKTFAKIITDFPETGKADLSKYNMAWSIFQQERYEESASVFSNLAINSDSNSLKAMSALKLGQINKILGHLELAENNWKDIVTKNTDSLAVAQAHYELGLLHYEQKKYQIAIRDFQNVAKVGPHNLRLAGRKMLAESYLAIDDFKEAEKIFKNISSAEKDIWLESLYQQGWIQYKNKNWVKATEIFSQFKSIDTKNKMKGMALFWLAEIQFNQRNDFKNASELFLESSKFEHEKKVEAEYGYAWSLLKMKKYKKAETIFVSIEKKNTISVELRGDIELRLADISFATKKYSAAASRYQSARKLKNSLKPEQIWHLYSQLAKSYRRLGKNKESRKIYEQALREFPHRAEEIRLVRAEVLFAEGKYKEFISELDPYAEKFSDACRRAKAKYEIGDAWYNLQEYKKAIENYTYVLSNRACKKYQKHAWGGVLYASAAMGNISLADEVYNSFSDQFGAAEIYDIRIQQGKYLLDNRYYKESEISFNAAIIAANNPDAKAEAFSLIAISFAHNGKRKESTEAKENAFGLYSEPDNKVKLALALIADARNRENYQLVKKWLDRVKKIRPKDNALRIEKDVYEFDYYIHSGDYSSANIYYRKLRSTQINNDYISSIRDLNIGLLKYSEKKYNESKSIFIKILQKRTGIIAAEAQLSFAYAIQKEKEGNDEKVIEEFLRVRYLYGDYKQFAARSLYEVARIYENKGEKKKAKNFYAKIVKEYGDSQWAEMAKGKY